MNYKSKTLSAISWVTLLRILVRIGVIAKLAILARLLPPKDFGVFGMTILVLGLLEILTETGINVFLLQTKENFLEYIDTAFVMSIFRGSLIAILILVTAPTIANFFHNSASTNLFYLTAIIPIIRGFINPACVKLLKNLDFNLEFFYRMGITYSEIIMSVILILLIKSPSALIIAMAFSAIIEVIFSYIFIRPLPKFSYNKLHAKEILKKGRWVTIFGLFDYTYSQGDNIAVGRMLSSSSLGVYQNAYKLATLPMTEVGDIYYRVNFPIFSKMLANKQSVKETAKKTSVILMCISILVTCFIFTFSSQVVNLVLGPAWVEAVALVKILAIVAGVRSISFSFNPLHMAHGHQKWVSFIIGTSMAGLLVSIVPLINSFGIMGASYAALFGVCISLPVSIYFASKVLKIS